MRKLRIACLCRNPFNCGGRKFCCFCIMYFYLLASVQEYRLLAQRGKRRCGNIKKNFLPFSLAGVWLNIRMDSKDRTLFPLLQRTAGLPSVLDMFRIRDFATTFLETIPSYLPSYSDLFIDSLKQQVFIENCAVGRYSILWRYVGG